MKKNFIFGLIFFISNIANALSIDTMLLVGDKSGNGVFTLTNDDSYTTYVSGSIIKFDVQGEEIIRTPYDNSNLMDWEITLTHPQVIIESGLKRNVGVRSLCIGECNFDKDRVYQINFAPAPYSENEGEAPVVALNVGYAPLYIIPAHESKVSYNIENNGEYLYVENTGNTFIRVGIDQCTKEIINNCRAAFTVLAGRKKSFLLPEGIQSHTLNAVILNHDSTYVRRVRLTQ